MNKTAYTRKRPLNYGNAFMLFLVIWQIVLSMALGAMDFYFGSASFSAFMGTPWFIIASEVVGFVVPVLVWQAFTKPGVRAASESSETRASRVFGTFDRRKIGAVNILLIAALCLFLQPVMMFLSGLGTAFAPNNIAEAMSAMQRQPFAVMLAAIALTPALCEEAAFRGYIFSRHMENTDIKKAALINGLFFAIMHMDAQQFLYAFVMGVIFAYFVYCTRSLYASVLAHFCVNGMQLTLDRVLTALVPLEPEAIAEAGLETGGLVTALINLGIISLIMLPAVIILFRTFISHNKGRNLKREVLRVMRVDRAEGTGEALALLEPEITDSDKKDAERIPRPAMFDLFFWCVAAIYLLFATGVLEWIISRL
ncbi:MAG: CPBP family intramembrane metalloprotease [Clostridiales bacterium]|jgi:membrane protease YdiL (CAAX protease family)|nr:CPBP family intramembrane metalloprotease [Clostridiales bacterium]